MRPAVVRLRRLGMPLLALALVAGVADAHEPRGDVRGEILLMQPDQADTGLFALVESLAPGTIPHGLFWYVTPNLGGCFILEGIDRYADLPTAPYVSTKPDFDLKSSSGDYGNGPSDEAGVIPGGEEGDILVIWLHYGPPNSEFVLHWC